MNNEFLPRRVAVTGVGVTCPLGKSFDELLKRVYAGESSIIACEDRAKTYGLSTHLASVVEDFDEKSMPRQLRRSMSRVAMFAVEATQKAIQNAGSPLEFLESERTGLAYGSTMGGTAAIEKGFASFVQRNDFDSVLSTSFLQMMSHTCGANIATALGFRGRLIASSTACASGLQAIGFAFENIRFGICDTFMAGGAEEFHPFMVGVFDTMRATSVQYNHSPNLTPRPFDKDRDGLVVGEGAGTIILENWNNAVARGAKIYAEIVGFHTNSDGSHMTNPSVDGMERVMRGALANAGLVPEQITYVNAHGTATSVGDIAESQAIQRVFGKKIPVSSVKGHFGHLMGASGVVESIVCLGLLGDNKAIPTLNLTNVDPHCAEIDYVIGELRNVEQEFILKNSFGFGGVNATAIFKKVR